MAHFRRSSVLGGPAHRAGQRVVTRRLGRSLLLVPLLLATLLASAASAQTSTFSVGTVIQGPTSVTPGATNVPGSLVLTNQSSGLGPVTLTSITYHPSCSDFNLACNMPESGVFTLSPTATGTGPACEGRQFTVTADAAGRYTFTTQPPIVLSTPGTANSTCTINFTFNVLRVPNVDSQPATPLVQTTRSAIVSGTAQITSGGTANGVSRSLATITVPRVQSAIATQVSSSTVVFGGTVSDSATVTGAANVPLTGTVTFNVYGPADTSCAGPSLFANTVALAANGTASSGPFTPTGPGTYRFVASYSGDANNLPVAGVCNAPTETVTVLPAGRYVPLTPARILDTRTGIGGINTPVGPGSTTNVQVTGLGGVPATGVTAVAMNVTVTQPTGDGFLTIYPSGTVQPLAANLNFTPAKTVPNLVVVKVGSNGRVAMFNSAGSTHVIYDVAGYFSDDPTGNDGRFQPLTPARIVDTRTGTGGSSVRLGPGTSREVQVAGQGGVPVAGAQAVVMNVAVTNTDAPGYLTVYPTGEPQPLAANLNWAPGDTVSNRVIAKLGANGRVTVYNNAGSTDVIVDVNGWFTDASQTGTSGTYAPLTPARILDTRTGAGGISGPRPGGSTVDVQVGGLGGVPSWASAVVLNATVVAPKGPGYLTVFPAGTAQPLASDLNYAAGEIRPNLVVVELGAGGKVSLFTSTGTDVVFDVAGFIVPSYP